MTHIRQAAPSGTLLVSRPVRPPGRPYTSAVIWGTLLMIVPFSVPDELPSVIVLVHVHGGHHMPEEYNFVSNTLLYNKDYHLILFSSLFQKKHRGIISSSINDV